METFRKPQEPALLQPFPERATRTAAVQLDDLERLRAAGMAMAVRLADHEETSVSTSTVEQRSLAFTRVARAVRQIIVLEQEILGLRTYSVRQYGVSQEQRANEARRIAGEAMAETDREAAERPDLRDTNDLREPDDLNDYDDNGAALRDVIVAAQEAGQADPNAAMTASESPPTEIVVQRPTASAMPHIPIRRRAILRGRGPPDG